jgi:hypothetical protein
MPTCKTVHGESHVLHMLFVLQNDPVTVNWNSHWASSGMGGICAGSLIIFFWAFLVSRPVSF